MGGRAEKRRRGVPKVKLPQKNRSKFLKPQFTSAVVQKNWDNTMSARPNLEKLGITTEPNAEPLPKGKKHDPVEFFDIKDLDEVGRNPGRRVMSEEDQKYAAKLIARYGDDYKRMSMDIEMNWYQHGEQKLKRMCRRFLSLAVSQRLVPVPESVDGVGIMT